MREWRHALPGPEGRWWLLVSRPQGPLLPNYVSSDSNGFS